jgi:hypothetical protein
MTARNYARAFATAALALTITSAYAASPGLTNTPSNMGDQSCQAWTDAKDAKRSAMVAWLTGFLDGEIAALDYYADGNQAAVKMPPLAVDLREMDSVCSSHPGTSIRQNAIDTFLKGKPR